MPLSCRVRGRSTLFEQMRDESRTESRVTRLVREPSRTRRVTLGAAALVIALAVGVPLAIHQNARREASSCTASAPR